MLCGLAIVGGGEGGLLVDADEAVEVAESEGSVGTATRLGEALGDTFGTGLDNLDPPDVLATVFGPPTALPGLEALELGAESGESRLDMDAIATAVPLAALGVSLSELSEADVEESTGARLAVSEGWLTTGFEAFFDNCSIGKCVLIGD